MPDFCFAYRAELLEQFPGDQFVLQVEDDFPLALILVLADFLRLSIEFFADLFGRRSSLRVCLLAP